MNTQITQRFAALGAAAFMTLAMLLSVHTLSAVDSDAPQMAQAATTRA